MPSFLSRTAGKAQTVELSWDSSRCCAELTDTNADVSADNLPPPTLVVRVQIDDGSFGRDTFGNHLNLCRNDKMNDCCCISGT